MLLTLLGEAILLSGHIGVTFPRQREFNQLSVCAQFVTHHMQKEMRKFEKFKFWLLKAKLIKRPGIENPIYQTTLETFPSAIFSIFFGKSTQTVTFSELEEVHFLHCPQYCVG